MRKPNLNSKDKEANHKPKVMKGLDISNLSEQLSNRVKYIRSHKPKYQIVDLLNVDESVFCVN
jgi:hypothetical protein